MLGSARSKEFMTVAGRDRARSHLRERGIAGLVVIGGNGSLAGATALTDPAEAGDDFRCTVTGVPASIDNDIGLTGMAIGVDTAMNTIVEACDKISDTASAHDRTFMRDEDELHDKLRAAHKEVMGLIAGVSRTRDVKDDVKAVVAYLGTEDRWFSFRAAADAFLKAYGTLSPDPRVLPYQRDLKFVAAVLPYGRLHFEKVEETDWKRYSEKIRAMLDEHLELVKDGKAYASTEKMKDPVVLARAKTLLAEGKRVIVGTVGHYVYLTAVLDDGILVHDPAGARVQVSGTPKYLWPGSAAGKLGHWDGGLKGDLLPTTLRRVSHNAKVRAAFEQEAAALTLKGQARTDARNAVKQDHGGTLNTGENNFYSLDELDTYNCRIRVILEPNEESKDAGKQGEAP